MRNTIAIDDIEEVRRQLGIDDVELRLGIRQLKVGDIVHLSLVTAKGLHTVPVRITSIRGYAFRGKLTGRQPDAVADGLPAGATLAFKSAHIHSIKDRHNK
jgi:hypothetical protein